MTELLRREIVRPTQAYTRRTLVSAILIAGGGLAAGLAVALAPQPAAAPHLIVIEREPLAMASTRTMPVEAPAPPALAAPRASEIQPVFRAGGATYMAIISVDPDRDAAEVMPKHGALRHVPAAEPGWTETAIAPVSPREVPAAHRSWQDRDVIVEGGCAAKVSGFAVVARLTGDVGYAPAEDDDDAGGWTAARVFELGGPVLAARLDVEGCAEARYARDAALAPIVVPLAIDAPELAAQARALLIASPVAAEAQQAWREELEGAWHASTPLHTLVVRHPVTGVTWVSVHGAADEGCGGPDVNVWGLFRVDARGTLVPVELRNLGELHAIASLIDVDGDGELELLGAPWLANATLITRRDGEELMRDEVPFYGCAC